MFGPEPACASPKRLTWRALLWSSLLGVMAMGCTDAVFVPMEDGMADADPDSGGGNVGRDAGDSTPADLLCEAPSMPSCMAESKGICDPVCQTGDCDWCGQKCSYVYAAEQGEVVPACVGTGTGTLTRPCTVSSSGSERQSDDCAPGSICLAPDDDSGPTYCFGLCRSQADCLFGSPCGQRALSSAGGVVDVCDPPFDICGENGKCCDPFGEGDCGANRYCLLVSPDATSQHSRTVCEFSYGRIGVGSACTSARDCGIRNVCVNHVCRQVCSSEVACPSEQNCLPWGSEYGYCS